VATAKGEPMAMRHCLTLHRLSGSEEGEAIAFPTPIGKGLDFRFPLPASARRTGG